MKIVTQPCRYEEIIKKSRFIGVIGPCQSEREALLMLKSLYEQHPDASHIVYAYRIQTQNGLICRFHDAGEPSGTAGKPIFQHLEGKQLINLLVAVIRYYGGVKLGAGGLIRAYGNIARQTIETAQIIDYVERVELQLQLDYNQLQTLEYHLKKFNGEIISQDFADRVVTRIRLPKQHREGLLSLFQ